MVNFTFLHKAHLTKVEQADSRHTVLHSWFENMSQQTR